MNELKYNKINEKTFNIKDDYILPKYTILVGKNGSGKSTFLISLYNKINNSKKDKANVFYVSPERFGTLNRTSGLEDASYVDRSARNQNKLRNQSDDFITESLSNFNSLISRLNRNKKNNEEILQRILDSLNNKINKVEFSYSSDTDNTPLNFKINNQYNTEIFSSGTNQIIALITSIVNFVYSGSYSEDAVLLLDEPDVHIHSDLQIEFVKFIVDLTKNTNHKVIIAAHSSSIISGLCDQEDAYIATQKDDGLDFFEINDISTKLLPSLGSHSLSHVFNKSPLLMVEGDDDYLVWTHAIRKSKGKIKFHLVEVGGKDEFCKYENLINKIAIKLFDKPIAYEIRDRDDNEQELIDENIVKRSYLKCREIENLILSNEVLEDLETNWIDLKKKLDEDKNFKNIDRYKYKINQEYTLIKLIKENNTKSWELLVGTAIAKNINKIDSLLTVEGSIFNMLGDKICNWIRPL